MPTVLLAEADRDLLDGYSDFMSRHGFQVDSATNGLECLAKLRRFVPDLLVLDLELPWGGGDGVLALLCEDSRLVPNSVILLSGVHSEPVLGNLAMPPVVKKLAKPVLLSALLKHAAPTASNGNGPPLNGQQRRGILVVDDEFFVRDSLQKNLHLEGFHVWAAGSGEEALDHCCDHGAEIALVLLDVQMPGLNGPQTLAGIQAYDADIPVCFMTGDPGDYDPSELLGQGARHLFTKPFCMDEVVRVVRDLADQSLGQLQES
jgi:DNA-binding response OmpR family regulator